MIHDHDRSYYIGASDTKYVMGNWNTQTFRHWWNIKMGFDDDDIDNIYLRTGTLYEPKILDEVDCKERDRQIIIGRLRVNLDGENDDEVIEVKTISKPINSWKPPQAYLQQVQVEMFASQKMLGKIVCYEVRQEDYEAVMMGETLPIDMNRMEFWHQVYDEDWIDKEYLPRLWYLCDCLEKEKLPCMEDLHLT